MLIYNITFLKIFSVLLCLFKKEKLVSFFKSSNIFFKAYARSLSSFLLVSVRDNKLKNLKGLLKKINLKKYKLLLFIDRKIFYIKKWLFFFKKRRARVDILKVQQKYIISLLISLIILKKKIVTIHSILVSNFDNQKETSLNLEKFSLNFKNNYIKENLLLWNGKWLNGTLTNFYGLKKDLKKEIIDFQKLKKIPEFVSLFALKNNEGFLNEVSLLGLPFAAISDSRMNPFFFHYYLPSNNNSGDILYFFTLLLLESFLRGFLKEINTVV